MTAGLSMEDLVLTANTIRGLAMDAVQKANSGHPGMPMGMADVASVLWLEHLAHNPENPDWADRDRFVLSAGHGAVLLYSLLHLSGYDLPLDQLACFRQWDSMTPGHPEYGHTPGVETTTGPLGQGCGNAVGMAIAERMLARRFNTEDFCLVDHHTYAVCGDGDLMEGISHEAFSLAGHLGLNKLVVFYDSNRITIEGSTDLAYSDNVKKRFQGYNWQTLEIDAHNYDEIHKAIRKARREKTRPTLIICNSHIACGSPNKQDSASAHGEALGEDEVRATKQNLGLPADRNFYVPDRVRELFSLRSKTLKRKASRWKRDFAKYAKAYPERAKEWSDFLEDRIPANLEDLLPAFDAGKALATRSSAGSVLNGIAGAVPWLVGGSADLAPSTKTLMKDVGSIGPGEFSGRNFHFGVREHGMAAIMNGIALHGGFRVFGATFFVFLDYCRPSVRLAAIMKLPVIYVFTHDSFYVGEDGPTHEPVEQLASLRCMPGVTVIRPADATEAGAAWITALRRRTSPTALILTRQNVPTFDRRQYPPASNLEKGAYTLWQSGEGIPAFILMASGSEVHLALESAKMLPENVNIRVVSMPSWELFEEQDESYRQSVLPEECDKRLAVEAGSPLGWDRYTGQKGQVVGMRSFGASAPWKVLAEKFGFTAEKVASIAARMI